MSMLHPIHVIGASGRSGVALCRALHREQVSFVPVVRNGARWHDTGLPGTPRMADLRDASALRAALSGAGSVVSCAHARWTPAIVAAAPEAARLVLMGSTRRFSRWPDAHGNGVRDGEAAFLASGRPGVMLHPTMIYGAQGEDNVQRLAVLLRRLPVAPLPNGGRSLVQPIHQDDVTAALLAALRHPWKKPEILVIAGPQALAYRDFLAAVLRAAGHAPRPVLPVPAGLLRLVAPVTRLVPGLPTIRGAELRRLLEDKSFDVAPMQLTLGTSPMPLQEGLARTFSPSSRD